jgi:hypothetical protein
MSATYLTFNNQIEKLTTILNPGDLQLMGTNPILVFKNVNSYPLYMVVDCSAGSVLYDFNSGGYFEFYNVMSGLSLFKSATYPLQTIQGFGPSICSPWATSDGFKRGTIIQLPWDMILTSNNGSDATQGDGFLTVNYYGLFN